VFVEWHHLRDQLRQGLHTLFARRVCAQEIRFAGAACGLSHLLPQCHGSMRVVPSLSGELDADTVGLRFLTAAVGKLHAYGSSCCCGLECELAADAALSQKSRAYLQCRLL